MKLEAADLNPYELHLLRQSLEIMVRCHMLLTPQRMGVSPQRHHRKLVFAMHLLNRVCTAPSYRKFFERDGKMANISSADPFTDEEIAWFATCGIDVARRQRLEDIAARQRARNPLRWLWRRIKAAIAR